MNLKLTGSLLAALLMPAFGAGTSWMGNVKQYQGGALQEWAKAVDQIVLKWSHL